MLNKFEAIEALGPFESAKTEGLSFSKLTTLYSENGGGKTTIAAIFRSLASGNSEPIRERRRDSVPAGLPVVLLSIAGTKYTYKEGSWNQPFPNVLVFDEHFVNENVFSGLDVDSDHRQALHELVIGLEGVSLSRRLQAHVDQVELHIAELRIRGAAISATARGEFSIDQFCELERVDDLDSRIQAAERMVAAAANAAKLTATQDFQKIELKMIDVASIESLLRSDLPSLEAEAATHIQKHIFSVGANSEAWIENGISLLRGKIGEPFSVCPFCAQDLKGSPVIAHYQAYFSRAYSDLKQLIAQGIQLNVRLRGGDSDAAFERSVSQLRGTATFWSQYCEIPRLDIDTLQIAQKRRAAFEAVANALSRKQDAPLEKMELATEATAAFRDFNEVVDAVAKLSERFQASNTSIELVKEQSVAGNLALLKADLAKLSSLKARFSDEMIKACADYQTEKSAKIATERLRDEARAELNRYQTTVFPAYNEKINEYLVKFSAGFRLRGMASNNSRAGTTCVYKLEVGSSTVSVGAHEVPPGEPSFKTMLSAGDRSTLALAFFFVSLDRAANLADSLVIIDDPMTSLDEHRTTATAQEVRALIDRCVQVITLSHNKPFLCRVWKRAGESKVGLQIIRQGSGSVFAPWNVNDDSLTDHDKRDKLMRDFVANGNSDPRPVAEAIRPHVEAYLRVTKSAHFPPGAMLGPFVKACKESASKGLQIIESIRIAELEKLNEYGTRFHHENPAWQTEVINNTELLSFVKRTLEFTDR